MVNPLANAKMLDLSNLNAIVEDKSNVTLIVEFVCDLVEKIMRKGESASYQHFLLFPECSKAFHARNFKTQYHLAKVYRKNSRRIKISTLIQIPKRQFCQIRYLSFFVSHSNSLKPNFVSPTCVYLN